MKIIASKDIQINGIYYDKGEEVEVKNKEQLIRLNEKGLIEPLTAKEIQDWGKRPVIKKFMKEEE